MSILSISTFHDFSEISFSGFEPVKVNLGVKEVTDLAQLYYGTENSESAQSTFEKIENRYLYGLQHHGSAVSKIITGLGRYILEEYLPIELKKKLRVIPPDSTLYIKLNEEASILPWELLHNGTDFLCLQVKMGRILSKTLITPERVASPRMLMVSNPTGDLEGASLEANHILGRLRGSKINVQRYGSEIRKNMYLKYLTSGRFDIVHYSGHSASSPEPGQSYHIFMDGLLYGYELENIQGDLPLLVFTNSCQSAESSLSLEKTGNTSLAGSYLRAGVSGCIAAIWPVSDQAAGEFASDFYTSLMFGDNVGSALLKSRRNAYKKWGFWDLIWASYIYYGNPKAKI